jgi:hypothetical protein
MTYKIHSLSCDVSRSEGKKIGYSFQSKITIKFGYKNPNGHIVEFSSGMS